MYLLCGHQPFEFPCTYIHLYIHAHIRCTCTGSGVEDKLHKQHCLEASAKFQLNTTAFMCYDWAFKSCKVQSGFPFSPALREWESVGIWLLMQLVFRSSARGPSGLMVRVSDYYSKSLEFESQLDPGLFFLWIYFTLSQQRHHYFVQVIL